MIAACNEILHQFCFEEEYKHQKKPACCQMSDFITSLLQVFMSFLI